MPRYAGSNFSAIDPEFRKTHGIGTGGGDPKKRRYAYGKQNNVLVASGAELFSNGFTIRLLPLRESSGGDSAPFVKFREMDRQLGQEVFGDWCRLLPCANWVGSPGVCFIIHDGNPETNPYDSPYNVLRNVAWNNRETPGIGRLFSELLSKNFVPNSHVGSLKKVEKTLFVSASGVMLNDQGQPILSAFTDDNKKNARIIGLKTSAAASLHAALDVRDESTGELLAGDMLSSGSAKLVTFLPETYTGDGKNRPALSADGPTGIKVPRYAQQNGPVLVGYPPSRSSMTHFCVIHDAYNGQQVSLEPYAERIEAETKGFDDYLFFPTFEEQAEMLAPAFPKEALEFAWREYPQYLRHLPRGTTTADVSSRTVEEMDEDVVPPRQTPMRKPAAGLTNDRGPAGPIGPAGELSEDEEAGVDNLFAAASPPPAARPAPANTAEIVARAKAAATRNR